MRRNFIKTSILAGIGTLSEVALAHSVLKWEPLHNQKEMTCKCGCGESNMDEDFMERLQLLRAEWYKENTRVLKVNSGFRCKDHPIERRKKIVGPHTKGKAVDILISGKDATRLFKMAKKYMSGIGYNFKGGSRSHYLHVDSLTPQEAERPAVWNYK